MREDGVARLAIVKHAGGTEVGGEHDDLPPGLSAADNETGWTESPAELAALVEASEEYASREEARDR